MVELPKDATGLVIPFDIDVLYDFFGNKEEIKSIEYRKQCSSWFVVSANGDALYAKFLYIENPLLKDSWEKLEKDLDRCIEKSDFCMYYTDGETCNKCPINNLEPKRCAGTVFENIKMRIRNLRGETHVR